MKKISLVTLFLLACTLTAAAQTQSNATPGPVWRVIYINVLPGMTDDFLMDLRRNTRPINEEYKKAGLIVDYKIYSNSTNDSPGDWDFAIAMGFKNWAALDEFTPKSAPIRLKHYGSAEKEQERLARRRQLGETVASKLVRELTLNPLP